VNWIEVIQFTVALFITSGVAPCDSVTGFNSIIV
jgi:hypothetical protein